MDEQALLSIGKRHRLGFVAIFGSSAHGQVGRDLDVAVMPSSPIKDLADRDGLFHHLSDALTVLPNAS
ncbi:MAG: hypothetical protein KF760_22930 [Candidatus Eremiobacteraeota bacterium]|nr:hypothetical protein [Candidatus Eremiobacteraeota bacterium]MCW5868366.1 hypothetical protein [Candidatus Eremiobacteraeota bacterium]